VNHTGRFYITLSIVAAVVTMALKFVGYFLTGSVGLFSDAAESIVNLVAAIVAFWALTLAARPADEDHAEKLFRFQQANGNVFLNAYLPIVQKRKDIPYSEREIEWQEMRRGRYVEFNLIHDRGTIFGLKTNGRTESILMSLPPRARWEYDYQPQSGTEEDKLLQVCFHPKDWT